MGKNFAPKFLLFIAFCFLIIAVGVSIGVPVVSAAPDPFAVEDPYEFEIPEGYYACTTWNILGVIVVNTDIFLGSQRHAIISMSDRDIQIATRRFADLERTLNRMAHGQMTAVVTTLIIETPLTQASRTSTTVGTAGYSPRPAHLRDLIANYVNLQDFDHIMFFLRTQCVNAMFSIPTQWGGLYQGMLDGVHYSQVLFSASRNCNWHNQSIFPERILVHEFIHGLERMSRARGISIPTSIDAPRSLYGYGTSRAELYRFYRDYMTRNIQTSSGNIGLTPSSFIILRQK